MNCLELAVEPFREEFYQQVSLRAKTPDCRWSFMFENNEKTHSFTLEFIVFPIREIQH
jgi:hypothetical protein